MVDKVFR